MRRWNTEGPFKDIGAILSLVAKSGLTLSLKKCHLAYQSLTALGHTVSNLGIGTAEGTIKAVVQRRREFREPFHKTAVVNAESQKTLELLDILWFGEFLHRLDGALSRANAKVTDGMS
jgi:hypothetical protein